MNNGIQKVAVERRASDAGLASYEEVLIAEAPATPAHQTNLFLSIHHCLRGRYPWVIILAILLGAAGGVGGWHLYRPKYQSIGHIRVSPVLPRILYRSEETQTMPMYDQYIGAQSTLLQSQRVLDRAMENVNWQELDRGLSPESIAQFKKSIEVVRTRGSQLMTVSFTDTDPDAAQTGVRSVIDAYMEIFGEQDRKRNDERFSVLEKRRDLLNTQIQALRKRIADIAEEFGSDSLDAVYDFKLAEMQKLESKLSETRMTVAIIGIEVMETDDNPPPPPELSAGQIARYDRTMEQLIQQRTSLELQLSAMQRYRKPDHPTLSPIKRQLETINGEIDKYTKSFNEARASLEDWQKKTTPQNDPVIKLKSLTEQERNLKKLYADAKTTVLDVGRKKLQINNLRNDIDTITARLEETSNRLEQLNVESSAASVVSGRIAVISRGERTGLPMNAKSRYQLTVVGAMAGMALALSMFLVSGMRNRRFRYANDAHENVERHRVLGILPRLPQKMNDPEQATIAAQCVHRIRTMLQMKRDGKLGQVFSVTSAASGDGKTSLVMALGLSFAASKSKTLLVDFDLVGQGLTSRMNRIAKKRIGRILLDEHVVSKRQLEHGLHTSHQSGQKIGETLVELGYAASDDIDRALGLQEVSQVGLTDALNGVDVEECITATDIPNLSLLPISAGGMQYVGGLSPTEISRFLSYARRQYDTVLVDTGPVPTSVEASVVASQADGVVFTLSAGLRQSVASHAIRHLESFGAPIAGLVFNRAPRSDLAMYGSSSDLASRISGSTNRSNLAIINREDIASEMGPIARATAMCVPPIDTSNGNGSNDKPEEDFPEVIDP